MTWILHWKLAILLEIGYGHDNYNLEEKSLFPLDPILQIDFN